MSNYLLVDPPPGLSFTLQFIYTTHKVDLGLLNIWRKTPILPSSSYLILALVSSMSPDASLPLVLQKPGLIDGTAEKLHPQN